MGRGNTRATPVGILLAPTDSRACSARYERILGLAHVTQSRTPIIRTRSAASETLATTSQPATDPAATAASVVAHWTSPPGAALNGSLGAGGRKEPEFGWSHSRIHRVESPAEGGSII